MITPLGHPGDTLKTPDIAATLDGLAAPDADRAALEERLYLQVYSELRAMAASFLRSEGRRHTLQPTELVHEAYIRLVAGARVRWEGRAHFFGAAARAMRQILVDYARRRRALKRGGDRRRVTLHSDLVGVPEQEIEIIMLDRCLQRMAELDARMAHVAELRLFVDMTTRDIAHVLGVSSRTVDDDWAVAKKWLRRELSRN